MEWCSWNCANTTPVLSRLPVLAIILLFPRHIVEVTCKHSMQGRTVCWQPMDNTSLCIGTSCYFYYYHITSTVLYQWHDSLQSQAKEYFLKLSDAKVTKDELKMKPLKKMVGPLMNLHVKEDAQPFAIQTQSLLPITIGMQSRQSWTWWWHEAFHTLDGQSFFSMLLSLVAVAMPNSGVRITTDFPGSTNHQVQCPVHPSQQYWHMDPKVHFLYQNNALCGTGWQTKLAEEDHDHLHAVAQWVLQQQGCLSSGVTWYCDMWTMHFAVTKTTSPLSSTSIRSITGCRKHKMTNFQCQVQCVGISSSAPKMHSLFAESHN